MSAGRSLIQPLPQMIPQTDVSRTGWGAFANDLKTGVVWSSMEKTQHINILELTAIYLARLTFTKATKKASVHLNRGVSTQQMEFCSRPGVSAKNGFLRMEAESKDLSKMSQSSNTKNRQNPATSEAKFRNGVGSTLVQGSSPSVGGGLCDHLPPKKERNLTNYWDLTET